MPVSCYFNNIKKLVDYKDVIKNNRILIRVDFNVPLNNLGAIEDFTRIKETLPTINFLLKHEAKSIIIISHLGRPCGKHDSRFSLKVVANELQNLLQRNVIFINDCIGKEVKEVCTKADNGQVIVLENLRFHEEEEKIDKIITKDVIEFRKFLSGLADVFVQDAFGCLHRPHSSIVGIETSIKLMGMLVEKEIHYLSHLIMDQKIDTIILGGAKVEDKIPILDSLLSKAQNIVLVGTVPLPFLKAKGFSTGDYCFNQNCEKIVEQIIQKAESLGTQIYLPEDFVVSADISSATKCFTIDMMLGIPQGHKVLDIGSKSIKSIVKMIQESNLVFWNGPVGMFEIEQFAFGTRTLLAELAKVTKNGAITILGGGDSAAAAHKMGFNDKLSHISTGGGASLEFIQGVKLPGIVALIEK